MNRTCCAALIGCLVFVLAGNAPAAANPPDLILHNGKIVTADKVFSVVAAIAVRGGRIVATGADAEVLAGKGDATKVVDLRGKMVLPGLIDSHVHPRAAMFEFDHDVPDMESIADVLAYVRDRAAKLGDGKWISVQQVFITRLKEQRYPARAELDQAAPKNPVLFSTGPDASLNSLALKLSDIDENWKVTDGGPGYAEKDPATGELTGILRGCMRYVKSQSSSKKATEDDIYSRTLALFRDYNANGITAVADRSADPSAVTRYTKMRDTGDLPVRMSLSFNIATIGELSAIQDRIRKLADHPLRKDDPMLKLVGIKTFLDGGMLTGSAYMRKPWGVSKIYSITDPDYRGVLLIPKERVYPLVRAAIETGLQFTAHSVGDGAVEILIDAYEQAAKDLGVEKVRATRPCITHSNFMGDDLVRRMPALGIVADIQPVWLYLDTRTLQAQFGYDRLRYFQPLKSLFDAGAIAGGGSDHMQKIGAMRAVNHYDPFLGMWVTVSRKARWHDGQLHPEEALSREQMIRFYTNNNAQIIFRDHQIGSLEAGKLADMIVVDRNLLTCPEDDIRETKVLQTYLGGKLVYDRK
ncbi:amidohydrolase [Humisphaera borealis]|uniref:Amidohydrolase n=1 Tax=Humisphaera borealis TaxID=2807512 RepID=A0A7M2X3M2_9BACT|nr:amidohydrolase [Humisphaera borealis]QOV92032.1 amidohydrolase [Humisphaera borealis]